MTDYIDTNGNSSTAQYYSFAGPHDSTAAPAFVDSANGNFAIGPALRNLGWPGSFPGATSTGYMDMGAVQGQCVGSSASWGR